MDFPTNNGESLTATRRRDRRVSFAETTAVHVFDRDDSLGTPTKNDSDATMSPSSDSGGDESSRDTREYGDDDDDEEDEEGLAVPPVRFVRAMTDSSPGSAYSPGSASAASVASNDGDNFFGPVSRSFIGAETDSGMSENNNNETHDITLDSTAFSLHYRNIGGDDRSANSAGSLLATPGMDNRTPFVRGGINDLSGANDTVGRLKFSDCMSSAGLGDLSFVANNSSKYDYGRLSTSLNNLLRQVDDSLKPNSPVPYPTYVQMDQGGDGAMLIAGEVSCPTDAPEDQNGGVAEPLTGKDPNPIDVSIDKNGDAAKCLTEEVAHPIDVLLDKNGDAARPVTGEVSCAIDVSTDKNGDSAKPPKEEISYLADVSMVQNSDGAQLVQREDPHQIDDKNSVCSNLVTGEVSFQVDMFIVQNGDGAKLLQREDPHQTDVSIDKNNNGAKSVKREVSHAIDVSMENNANCNEVQMLDTQAFDDEPSNGKDEDHAENKHGDFQSDTISYSRVTATSSPQNTTSLQVESAIALSSPLTTVEYPESKLPMVTPKVATRTSSYSKMAQLSETRQSPYISSKFSKHSESISAINEFIHRGIQKGNITLANLDFENENLLPSQSPFEKVVYNQEFDLEGRKRKLQLFLASIEDRPAKHAKSYHESLEHGEKHKNCNSDWSKLVEDMSEISRVSSSPSVQKLSIQELGSLSGMIEKFQMARKYERLSAFLRNRDSADQRQQRLAEARSLHDKLLYEKTKLELNRLKLNKLRSKAELACQRAQECLLLKSRISDLSHSSSREAYAEHNCYATSSGFVTQDEQDRLHSKRQALKAIEQSITKVSTSFRVSCKIIEDLSCDDIINIVKEHLKFKNIHSIVQRDLNAWKLHDIVKQDKWREIVLDYSFLFQRFILGTGKSGSILVNTTLNSAKILQAFRDMNAYSAIEFVFKTKFTVCNIDSSKFVRQETLETSLLLGNVIDVLHEVQAAKRELLNLISTNFNCKLGNTNMLELQLSFVNFERGKKVVLSLDLSDLKFGMYPSEPAGLHIEMDPTMTTFHEVSLKELTALVQRLPTGRLMVLRLCRAVSQYVHSSYM